MLNLIPKALALSIQLIQASLTFHSSITFFCYQPFVTGNCEPQSRFDGSNRAGNKDDPDRICGRNLRRLFYAIDLSAVYHSERR
jgi:hypothetical protein